MAVILTEEILNNGKSKNGAWNWDQFKLLGVSTPPLKGWKKNIIGRSYPESIIARFLQLKDTHLKKGENITDLSKHSETLMLVNQDMPIREQYLHPEWIKIRDEILKRDNFTCVICKTKVSELHVHHQLYLCGKFIWEIEKQHLITVCKSCHEKIHDRVLES